MKLKLNLTKEQVEFALRVSKALHLAANNADKLQLIATKIDGLLLQKKSDDCGQ